MWGQVWQRERGRGRSQPSPTHPVLHKPPRSTRLCLDAPTTPLRALPGHLGTLSPSQACRGQAAGLSQLAPRMCLLRQSGRSSVGWEVSKPMEDRRGTQVWEAGGLFRPSDLGFLGRASLLTPRGPGPCGPIGSALKAGMEA